MYGSNAIITDGKDTEPILPEGVTVQNSSTEQLVVGGNTEPVVAPVVEPTPAPTPAPEVNPVQVQAEAVAQASKELEGKGIDYKALQGEYEENGGLKPETLAKLAEVGYPKEVVDMFISGMEAQANKIAETVFAAVGGKDEYTKVTEFVKGLGDEAIDGFNAITSTGNVQAIKALIGGYKAQMVAKYGTQNPAILGGQAPSGVSEGFASKDEMVIAVGDARYGRDMAYTKGVEQKIIKSKFF